MQISKTESTPAKKIPLPEGVSLSFLPPFHASVNAITALVLIAAFVQAVLLLLSPVPWGGGARAVALSSTPPAFHPEY